MRFKIKIIEISDDLKSKSNHDFDFKIKIYLRGTFDEAPNDEIFICSILKK